MFRSFQQVAEQVLRARFEHDLGGVGLQRLFGVGAEDVLFLDLADWQELDGDRLLRQRVDEARRHEHHLVDVAFEK